jgi:hypothetical protein
VSSPRRRFFPTSWKPDITRLLPSDPSRFRGPIIAEVVIWAYTAVIVTRSCIHLFAPDGGAHSIATIDTTVAGGSNIIAMFGQWGASQLLLAFLIIVLLVRYRGLMPLIAVTFAVEPVLRFLAGSLKPLHTIGTAPGAALNDVMGYFMLVALYLALCSGLPRTAAVAGATGGVAYPDGSN